MYWGLSSGFHACQAGGLPLESFHWLFFALGIFEIGSCEQFAQTDFDCDPPDLCLLNRITGESHWCADEIGSHFTPMLAWTVILLFVLFTIAGMTAMCHHTLILVEMGSQIFAQSRLES
jgi:hypothetical protein